MNQPQQNQQLDARSTDNSTDDAQPYDLPPIQWKEITVPLSRLSPFEQNPRTITMAQADKLRKSLMEDGYHSRIKVTHDLRVIGGHQRLRIMKELGWGNIAVLVPDRELTDEQFARIMLRDNHNNGQWDMDQLANLFDLEYLRKDIGLHDIMDIAPEDVEEKKPAAHVRCPHCNTEFPVKGNKA